MPLELFFPLTHRVNRFLETHGMYLSLIFTINVRTKEEATFKKNQLEDIIQQGRCSKIHTKKNGIL